MWGTSFSAPYVTGTAALVSAFNPELTALEVKDILIRTASGGYHQQVNGQTYTYSMVNAYEAVKDAKWQEEKAQSEQSESVQATEQSESVQATEQSESVQAAEKSESELVETGAGENHSETETNETYIELTHYLHQNIDEVIGYFDGMEDEHVTSGGSGYTNGSIIFEASEADRINYISIINPCQCMIEGIMYGDNNNIAINSLFARGWSVSQQTEKYCLLTNVSGDSLSLYSENLKTVSMIRYQSAETAPSVDRPDTEVKNTDDIFSLLVKHYEPNGETVMEGELVDGIYLADVRTGVPGNPAASQRIYEVQVEVATGKVEEWNLLTNENTVYQLYED